MKLEDLKVGDEVCVLGFVGFGSRSPYFKERGKVEKFTKTQVTAFGGKRFSISSGWEIGCAHGRFSTPPRLTPITDEIIAKVELAEKMRHAESVCRRAADLLMRAKDDNAVRLAAMINEDLKAEAMK